MKNLLAILIVLFFIVGCNDNKKNNYHQDFIRANESIREFAKSYFDSNYVIMDGSIGSLNKVEPPIKTMNFIESDTLEDNFKIIHFEQRHLGVPTRQDSLWFDVHWVYYQLDENFKVVSYSRSSILK